MTLYQRFARRLDFIYFHQNTHSCVRCGGMPVCSVSHICRNLEVPWPTPSLFPWFAGYFRQWEQFGLLVAWAISQVCLTSVSEGSSNTDVFTLPLQGSLLAKSLTWTRRHAEWKETQLQVPFWLMSFGDMLWMSDLENQGHHRKVHQEHRSEACPKASACSRKDLGLQKVGFYLEKCPIKVPELKPPLGRAL